MAGKLCMGSIEVPSNPILSVAYCEGYKARTLSATPTNPHTSGTPEADAWDRGVAAKAGEAATDVDRACCAPCGAAAV